MRIWHRGGSSRGSAGPEAEMEGLSPDSPRQSFHRLARTVYLPASSIVSFVTREYEALEMGP